MRYVKIEESFDAAPAVYVLLMIQLELEALINRINYLISRLSNSK